MFLKNLFSKLEEYLCFITFMVMLVLGFSNVIVRSLTNYSLASTQEIVINGMVTLTLFGGAIAIKKNQLLAVNFVLHGLRPILRKVLYTLISIAVIITLGFLCSFMFELLANQYDSLVTSSALQVKMWYYTALLPLSFMLMMIRQFEFLIKQLTKKG